jgi:thioredoxin 1
MEHTLMKEITQENFTVSVLESEKPVLVDFWAKWCPPCLALSPILEKLAGELESVTISRLNIDENPELAARYNVKSIPTLIIFKDGAEQKRLIGLSPAAQIKAVLNAV